MILKSLKINVILALILLAFQTAGGGHLIAGEKPEIRMGISAAKVYLGESFILKIQIRNTETDKTLDVEYLKEGFDLEFLGKEPISHSITITINGKTTHTEEKGATFVYRLTPKRDGKIQIESPALTADSETISADPVTIEVISPKEQDMIRLEMSAEPEKIYPAVPFDLFLTVSVKELPGKYKSENPIPLLSSRFAPPELTISWGNDDRLPSGIRPEKSWSDWLTPYHNQRGGFSINQVVNPDPFNSFFNSKPSLLTFLPAPKKVTVPDDAGNDAVYWQYKFRRKFTAEQIGDFNFGSVILKGTFVKEDEDGTLKKEDVYTITKPFTITVSDIPSEGRPADYAGAIGKFNLLTDLAPSSARVGEAITYSITLNGIGSVLNVHAPDLAANENLKSKFKIYPPTETVSENQVKWTWTLRPLKEGSEPFPSVNLSYFDTDQNQYVTLSSDPIPLTVEKGSSDTPDFEESASESEPNSGTQKTAAGIYANIEKTSLRSPLSFRCYSITAGFIWGGILLFCGCRKLIRRNSERTETTLTHRIKKGEELLRKSLSEDLSQGRILQSFLLPAAPLFDSPIDVLTHSQLNQFLDRFRSEFSEGSIEEMVINRFRDFSEMLEQACYSGSPVQISHDKILSLYRDWTDLLKKHTQLKAGKETPVHQTGKFSGIVLLLITLLLTAAAGCSNHAELRGQLEEANRLFNEADLLDDSNTEKSTLFFKAAALYEGILRQGGETGAVLYNQGNAYYRAGDNARALASWRKAQKYIPGDRHLNANIRSVKQGNTEKDSLVQHLFFWQKRLSWQTKGFLLLLISGLGGSFLVAAEFTSKPIRSRLRRMSLLLFILALLCFGSLLLDRIEFDRYDHAIIAVSDTFARKGGSPSYEPVFKAPIPLLTETRIIEVRNGWIHLRFNDGETGWIESEKAVRW